MFLRISMCWLILPEWWDNAYGETNSQAQCGSRSLGHECKKWNMTWNSDIWTRSVPCGIASVPERTRGSKPSEDASTISKIIRSSRPRIERPVCRFSMFVLSRTTARVANNIEEKKGVRKVLARKWPPLDACLIFIRDFCAQWRVYFWTSFPCWKTRIEGSTYCVFVLALCTETGDFQ